MTKYAYTLVYQPAIDKEHVSTIDILDKDQEPVGVIANDACCSPWNAATQVVKSIIHAELEKEGDSLPFPPEEMSDLIDEAIIPKKMRPHHSGGATYFALALRSRLSRFLQQILDRNRKGDKEEEYLNIRWKDVDDEGSIQFFLTFQTPSYEGEDWEEIGRLSEYSAPMGCHELGVMYEGVSHQTFIQLLDSGEDKKVRHYTKARVFYTTRDGKLVSFIMVRKDACWEPEDKDSEALSVYLEQSGTRLYELSYLLEAHVRWVIKKCDMPVILPNYTRLDDELFLRDRALLLSGTTKWKYDETVLIAPGVYKTAHYYDADGKTMVKLLVAHTDYAEDFFSPPPSTVEWKKEVEVVAGDYFLIGDAGLEPRVKEQEKEFLPYLMSRVNHRFVRPGICNYLGAGFGVKLRKISSVKVNCYTATEGARKGKVVAFDISL